MLIEFIHNHLANKWERKKRNHTHEKFYKKFEDQVAENYGYNLISGIGSDSIF